MIEITLAHIDAFANPLTQQSQHLLTAAPTPSQLPSVGLLNTLGVVPFALLILGVSAVIATALYFVNDVRNTNSGPQSQNVQSQSTQTRGDSQSRLSAVLSRLPVLSVSEDTDPEQSRPQTDKQTAETALDIADEKTIQRAREALVADGTEPTRSTLNLKCAELLGIPPQQHSSRAAEKDDPDDQFESQSTDAAQSEPRTQTDTESEHTTDPEENERPISGLVDSREQYTQRLRANLALDKVEEHESYIETVTERGDTVYRRVLIVSTYPDELPITWLDNFLTSGVNSNSAQLKVTFNISPLDTERTINRLQTVVRASKATIMRKQKKGKVNTTGDEQRRQKAKHILKGLKSGTNKTFDVSLYIEVSAPTVEDLTEATSEIRTETRKKGVKLVPLYHRQLQGSLSASLSGRDTVNNTEICDLDALKAFMPFKDPNVMHPTGALFGHNQSTQKPAVVDPWELSGHSIAITGKIGVGKSFYAASIIWGLMFQYPQMETLIIDPRGGLDDIVNARNGDIVDITSGTVLNPLRIEPLADTSAIAQMEGHPWDNKLDSVMSMLKAHFDQSLSKRAEGIARRALYHSYLQQGISRDVETHHRDNPTLGDFRDILWNMSNGNDPHEFLDVPDEFTSSIRQPANSDQSKEIAEQLYFGTEEFAEGGQYDHLNGTSTVSLNSQVAMFDLSGVPEDENNLFMQITLDWLFQRAKKTTQKNVIAIDETHYMFRSKQATKMLNLYTRQSRHNQSAMMFITQTVDEFLRRPAAKDIYDQCDIKALLYHGDLNDDARKSLNLTLADLQFISNARKGETSSYSEALLIVSEVGKLRVRISPDLITAAVAAKERDPWECVATNELAPPGDIPPDKQHFLTTNTSPESS